MVLYEQFPKVTESDFARADFIYWFANKLAAARQKNRELYEQHVQNFNEALRLLKSIYGDNSAEAKYLRRKGVDAPPNFDRKVSAPEQGYADWLNVLHMILWATVYEDLTHSEVKGALHFFAELCDMALVELTAPHGEGDMSCSI